MKRPILHLAWVVATAGALALTGGAPVRAEPVRVKDLGKLSSSRTSALVGYGLVTGLAGTGDSPRSKATRQSIANMLSRFDLAVASEDIQSRNVASVMVTARLPHHARAGDGVDVTVTSIGDARSLAGGNLMLAPLKGPDGRIYALAQGPLTVGGYRHDAHSNLVQKNHPTVGLISGGATVEVGMAGEGPQPVPATLLFVLHEEDYTTAGRVADRVNDLLGEPMAEVRDGTGIEIRVPEALRSRIPTFVRQIEALSVDADQKARVVVNERTGTVVSGGEVRIGRVAISHGDIKVTVAAESLVSQPQWLRQPGPDVRTQLFTNSTLAVNDAEGMRFVAPQGTTVADLIQSLGRLKVSTRDVIAILQAIKASGALHAELVVQ